LVTVRASRTEHTSFRRLPRRCEEFSSIGRVVALPENTAATWRDATLDGIEIAAPMSNDDHLLAVNEALEQFALEYPDKAKLVKLRFFTGMSLTEAAAVLGMSDRTAKRHLGLLQGVVV
jgi:DNA-directed RNA polymerase specialized sigma24 family protein